MGKRLALAYLTGAIACSGGFPGTWNVSSGTTQVNCGPLGGSSNEEGTFTITQTGTQLSSTFSSVTCPLSWTVETSSTATLVPNQSCSLTEGGITTTVTFATGTATLLGATNLSVSLAGSGPLTDGGAPNTCNTTVTFTGT